MPRPLILGNGNLLATFDDDLQMRDLYFPYVGMEDHTEYGHRHRVGVYIKEHGVRWLDDDSWEIEANYKAETLITESIATNRELGLRIISHDFVHPIQNSLVRSFTIESQVAEEREVKLFFHHDLHIYGDKQKDTAFYEPHSNTVIHYRGNRYFLIGGTSSHPSECKLAVRTNEFSSILKNLHSSKECGLSDYTVGKIGYKGLEGTWRDAEDGQLTKHPIEQGSVDSTVGIYSKVSSNAPCTVNLWLCAGKNINQVLDQHNEIVEKGASYLEQNCHNYWKSWVNKSQLDFGDLKKEHIELYKRSLLTVRQLCDNRGGIIAAADADIMEFNKDTYTYVWPRDGAFITLALDKAGYHEVSRRFFEFCNNVQMPDGYLLHKYSPDGSVGSSWHPWFKNGEAQLPIQEDETSLVIYAIYKHFEIIQDFEFLQKIYEEFIQKAANFLAAFTEESTGLPLASYDLWEEQRGVFTYTTACTIAGLDAAAKISHILGHFTHSERYVHAADKMRQAMLFHLYSEKDGRFCKKIVRAEEVTTEVDPTVDSSLCAIWKLGVLPIEDKRVKSTMKAMKEHLTVQTSIGGIARYESDYYHAVSAHTKEVTGNPWILTTLWLAQWKILHAKTNEELKAVQADLDWAVKNAHKSGLLAEQLDPFTGEPLSVGPLTWSHATYIETITMYIEQQKKIHNTK